MGVYHDLGWASSPVEAISKESWPLRATGILSNTPHVALGPPAPAQGNDFKEAIISSYKQPTLSGWLKGQSPSPKSAQSFRALPAPNSCKVSWILVTTSQSLSPSTERGKGPCLPALAFPLLQQVWATGALPSKLSPHWPPSPSWPPGNPTRDVEKQ